MKTHFKFILCFVGILSITACGSSDPDLPGSGGTGGDDETLVTLAGDRSFSLLSLSAGKGLASGTYNIQPLAAFIQENNTDVVALQDVDFGTARTGKKNLVGEVAYRGSKDGQRRQGIFASTGREDGGETGVALFVRECFYGTNKVNLNDELVLLTAPYELGSGETVLIATCQFDKEDANKRVGQAEADPVADPRDLAVRDRQERVLVGQLGHPAGMQFAHRAVGAPDHLRLRQVLVERRVAAAHGDQREPRLRPGDHLRPQPHRGPERRLVPGQPVRAAERRVPPVQPVVVGQVGAAAQHHVHGLRDRPGRGERLGDLVEVGAAAAGHDHLVEPGEVPGARQVHHQLAGPGQVGVHSGEIVLGDVVPHGALVPGDADEA